MPGGEQNTYGLPDGEAIRVEMAAIFREQRLALLGWMDSEGYKAFGLPMSWPSWESLRLGASEIAGRVRGAIVDIWESSGKSWLSGHGKDPGKFDVSVPPLSTQIDAQVYELAVATNEGTSARLDGLLTRVTDEFNRNEKTLAESIKALRKGIVEEVKPMEAWRARRIAVTEAARGYHSALNAAAVASGFVTGWQWLLADGACPLCEMIAEECQFVPLGQPFAIVDDGPYGVIDYPPAHPNCLLPETPVVAPFGVAGIVAQYNGPVVRLVFADGTDITVTPNHMLLTAEGFATAASLVEGDDVICCGDGHGMAGGGPDDDRKPSTIKQVVDTLSVAVGVSPRRVPVSPEDLHGDAACCEGEVYVIAPDRLLANGAFGVEPDVARLGEKIAEEFLLERGFLGRCGLPAEGDLATVLFALRDATDGGVGSIRERKAALRAQSRHPQLHGVGCGPWHDPEFDDSLPDRPAGDAESLRDCQLRFPGFVTTTKLVKVDRDTLHYVGPVYDVQTLTSLYLAGNVVSSNCRCDIVEIVLTDEQPDWGETLVNPVIPKASRLVGASA